MKMKQTSEDLVEEYKSQPEERACTKALPKGL